MRFLRTARPLLTKRYLSSKDRKDRLVDLAVDEEGIAMLSMQRFPVNCINLEHVQDLFKALDEVEQSRAKGLIVTSACTSTFSAGMDITEICNANIERLTAFVTKVHEFWIKLFGAPYPTAAAINGHAPAGGCVIALGCEYRTMVNGKFKIGLNETKVGIAVPQWLVDTMCHVIPQREAELALTTGRMFSVEEALKVGLIDEIASDKEDAIEKSKHFIRRFDKISPTAYRLTKQRIRANLIESCNRNLEVDLNDLKQLCFDPKNQKSLGMYLDRLKQETDK